MVNNGKKEEKNRQVQESTVMRDGLARREWPEERAPSMQRKKMRRKRERTLPAAAVGGPNGVMREG